MLYYIQQMNFHFTGSVQLIFFILVSFFTVCMTEGIQIDGKQAQTHDVVNDRLKCKSKFFTLDASFF